MKKSGLLVQLIGYEEVVSHISLNGFFFQFQSFFYHVCSVGKPFGTIQFEALNSLVC